MSKHYDYYVPVKQDVMLCYCVMCGQGAHVIAPETNEALCPNCARINNECRRSK